MVSEYSYVDGYGYCIREDYLHKIFKVGFATDDPCIIELVPRVLLEFPEYPDIDNFKFETNYCTMDGREFIPGGTYDLTNSLSVVFTWLSQLPANTEVELVEDKEIVINRKEFLEELFDIANNPSLMPLLSQCIDADEFIQRCLATSTT